MHIRGSLALILTMVGLAVGCATDGQQTSSTATRASLYPRRPVGERTLPIADPPLQRPTMHLTLTREGLEALLDTLVLRGDTGAYALLGARTWSWERKPFALAFDDARKSMVATTDVTAVVDVPGAMLNVTMKVKADVQPVLTAQHKLVLQAVTVKVSSDDRRVRFADTAGLIAHVEKTLTEKLTTLQIDLQPAFMGLHTKLAAPLFLPLEPASACFTLDLRGLEAGPTILADGWEKELALTVAPSLTMPCTGRAADGSAVVVVDGATPGPLPPLPPLKNSSGIEGGPFALRIPIAAGYDELQKAMGLAFPDGKLFFSTDQPHLYITDPEVFAAGGDVVVRVRIGGYVEQGVRVDVDGDLYLAGKPTVRDNFLEFPDLRPTVETDQALLKVAVALKEQALVDTVKKALRLDLSARLATVKQKLTDALTMEIGLVDGVAPLCTSVEIGRVAVDDIAVHDPYLRATVSTTAVFSASLPCPGAPATVPLPVPVAQVTQTTQTAQ
jgi:hypothetical protein